MLPTPHKILSCGTRVCLGAILVAVVSIPQIVCAQNPSSDPQASTLASQAITALTSGQGVQDITLTGSALWGPGGGESASITLKALGRGESRIDLRLAEGTRTEIRDASAGFGQGEWISPNGQSGAYALHNTLTDAVWFFPEFSSLAVGPNTVLTYLGQEIHNARSVQHIRSTTAYPLPSPDSGPTWEDLSTMDFYLDAVTSLPVAVRFKEHPETDAMVNIQVEVDFSNYQVISGVMVPMRIEESANGASVLDITITGVALNSGLNVSAFAVN